MGALWESCGILPFDSTFLVYWHNVFRLKASEGAPQGCFPNQVCVGTGQSPGTCPESYLLTMVLIIGFRV